MAFDYVCDNEIFQRGIFLLNDCDVLAGSSG